MKRTVINRALSALLMLHLSSLQANPKKAPMAHPKGWCPYSCEPEESDAGKGIIVDISEKILKDLGYEPQTSVYAFKRALINLKKGSILAIPGAYKEEIPDAVFPELPFSRNHMCFWAVGKASVYKDISGLMSAAEPVGIVMGYQFVDPKLIELQKSKPKKFKTLKGDYDFDRLLSEVKRKNISAFFYDEYSVQYLQKKGKVGDPVYKVACDQPTHSWLAISKKWPDAKKVAAEVSKIYSDMMSNGEVSAIYKKYGLNFEN